MKKLKGRKGRRTTARVLLRLPRHGDLEAGGEDQEKSLSAETKKAAASFNDKLAKLRRRDAMESDDDDDDGLDDDDNDDGLDDDDDDGPATQLAKAPDNGTPSGEAS